MIQRYILILFLFFFIKVKANSQSNPAIIYVHDNVNMSIDSILLFVNDSLSLFTNLDSINKLFIEKGYLASSVDKIELFDSIYHIDIDLGNYYNFNTLDIDDSTIDTILVSRNNLNLKGLYNIYDRYLENAENIGYPLSFITIDSFNLEKNEFSISAHIDTVGKVFFDTIEVIGKTNITYEFISKYIDVNEGDLYNRVKLLSIQRKIDQLGYVSLISPPKVVFYGNRAKILLELKQDENNIFDFLIGVLPKSEDDGTKLLVTGDVTLSLFNKIGYGEHIYFDFKKYNESSQALNFNFDIPYISSLPIGGSTSLSILKEKDKYLTIRGSAGINYRNISRNYFVKWKYHESHLLNFTNTDSIRILSTMKLPTDLDFTYNGALVGIMHEQLDHATNPRQGFSYLVDIGIGLKETKVNNQILSIRNDSISFINSYDSLDLLKIQFDFGLNFNKYFAIWKKSTVFLNLTVKAKFDNDRLLKNEKFRIGGSKDLRGFDEESIYSDFFSIINIEYRLLLSQNSHLSFPFVNIAITKPEWMRRKIDLYYGMGGGLSFETKAGLFNFSVAVGKSPDVDFDFRRPKVHFGYLNIF